MPPVDNDLLPPLFLLWPSPEDVDDEEEKAPEADASAVRVTWMTEACEPPLGEAVIVEMRVVTALALEEEDESESAVEEASVELEEDSGVVDVEE